MTGLWNAYAMRFASLRLRLLAAVVDGAAFIGVIAALVGLGIAGVFAYGRVRGKKADEHDEVEPDDDEDDEPEGDQGDEPEGDEDDEREGDQGDGWEGDQGDEREGDDNDEWEGEGSRVNGTALQLLRSPHLHVALRGASAGLAVAARNVRGPGFRVVGLRRVDANTGAAVSIRSALIGTAFDQAWRAATQRLVGSPAQRQRDRMSALESQRRAVERTYADDPQARERAVIAFYKANKLNPLTGCGSHAAGLAVAQLVLALGSRRGQTIRDRLTGTRVIVDR